MLDDDEERIPYRIGEVYVQLTNEEVQERLAADKAKVYAGPWPSWASTLSTARVTFPLLRGSIAACTASCSTHCAVWLLNYV